LSQAETRTLHYQHQGETLELLLKRSRRKTMVMYVHATEPVEVRAPLRLPLYEVDSFVRQRLDWIAEARAELRQRPTPKLPGFKPGALRPFLGHQRVLLVKEGSRKSVEISGYAIMLTLPLPHSEERIRQTLQDHYRKLAKTYLQQRVQKVLERFPSDWPVQGLVIRKMKARWGSCSRQGVLCLNSLLMEQPEAAIDFVICHELCHIRHFHHGPRFYALMDQVMPDWREREQQLLTSL